MEDLDMQAVSLDEHETTDGMPIMDVIRGMVKAGSSGGVILVSVSFDERGKIQSTNWNLVDAKSAISQCDSDLATAYKKIISLLKKELS